MVARTMFLRAKVRKKDGKQHRYFSVVENRRVGQNHRVQRTVLYLGEINDSQEAVWRKTLQVFDETHQQYTTLSLFPEDREIPAASSDSIQVKLSEMELRRPRAFGNCWLGCELWRQLRLEEFWEEKLAEKVQRETVSWAKVLQLLVVNRLIDPGSEFRVHRQWFDQSAMAELLETDFAVAEKDRLYRCLDRVLEHKAALFQHLRERWQDLFQAQFDVLLYDLTSTYIEGEGEEIPKAKYGYSRDQRFDCKQVVIATPRTARHCEDFWKRSKAATGKRGGCGSWIAAFRPKRCWRRCAPRTAKSSTWWGHHAARFDNTRRNGWICPGRRCASR